MMMAHDNDTRLALLERDMGDMKHIVESIGDATKEISNSLQKLTLLEERHAETRDWVSRSFRKLEAVEGRLSTVELEMPLLKQSRKWVVSGVLGIIALVGMQVFEVIKNDIRHAQSNNVSQEVKNHE
jgi:hypothetical protein